jgi:hypothetical protein
MWFLLVLALLQPVESGTAPGAEQWWIIVKFFDSPFFGGAGALGSVRLGDVGALQ